MKNYFKSFEIIRILDKWKKTLLITLGITVAASLIFTSSLFIKPKFRSFAIIYPANVIPFGTESTVEQMTQIMESNEIRTEIANKLDLMKHYRISPDQQYARTVMLKTLDDNITLKKTEYESIEIEVLDEDPKVAAEIVNLLIDLYNKKERSLQREKTQEVVTIIKRQFDKKKYEMDSLEDRLKQLRVKNHLLNYDAQTRVLARSYFKALLKNSSDLPKLEEMKRNLEEKGGEFIALSELAYRTRAVWNDLKINYENALKDVQKELTYTNIVAKPFPAEKKHYPIRWLITLICSVSVLFLTLIIIYIVERKDLFEGEIKDKNE